MRYLHIAILWWLKRLHGDRRWVSYFSPFICLQISCTSAQPWYYLECMWCSKIRIKYIWKGTRYVFAMMSCSKNQIIFVIHFCHFNLVYNIHFIGKAGVLWRSPCISLKLGHHMANWLKGPYGQSDYRIYSIPFQGTTYMQNFKRWKCTNLTKIGIYFLDGTLQSDCSAKYTSV